MDLFSSADGMKYDHNSWQWWRIEWRIYSNQFCPIFSPGTHFSTSALLIETEFVWFSFELCFFVSFSNFFFSAPHLRRVYGLIDMYECRIQSAVYTALNSIIIQNPSLATLSCIKTVDNKRAAISRLPQVTQIACRAGRPPAADPEFISFYTISGQWSSPPSLFQAWSALMLLIVSHCVASLCYQTVNLTCSLRHLLGVSVSNLGALNKSRQQNNLI